jgi:subtilisin family serine protease
MQKRLLGLVLFAAACGSAAPLASVDDLPTDARAKAPEQLWQAMAAGQARSFILAVAPDASERSAVADPAGARRAAKSRVRAAAELVLSATADTNSVVEADWDELPLVQVHAASLDSALAFIDHDEVVSAHEVVAYQLSDAQSFPLIDQPAAAAAGFTGAGTSVAILDTGVDYTRADFGTCTSPGAPSTCRVAYAHDFATDDGALDANGHGTNVAGIVAGVAPGTQVLALDVFNGESASTTDILSALNWVIANQKTYHIASLNLSLGGGSATAPCTGDAVGVALATARSAGIAPAVASGNDGTTNAISWPACAPAAISVGAVYDANVGGLAYGKCSDPTTAADQITCFSNSASFLSLLAPGALITAGGSTMAGTSQATPHVAGTFAVLRAAFPNETVDQLLARLTATGKKIVDARNKVTTPRIDLNAALHASSAADTTPPTGSVTINGGATAARSTAVTLAITAHDDGVVSQMCVTNTTACTAFVPFAASKAWTLAAGDGKKSVTVLLRDAAGNTSTFAASPTASITIDAAAPTNGTLTATADNAQLNLAWTGFADAGSGIANYVVVAIAGTTAPPCTATPAYVGTATTAKLTSLVNGTTYSVRVCAIDAAGNTSTGATASAVPHPASAAPPTGSVTINAGAALTKSRAVNLALTATGAAKISQMCISDGAACTTFVAFAATTTFTFASDGKHTLYVRFRDAWGLTSEPATAAITVDTAAPIGGALAAMIMPTANNLSWTAATDAGSGIAGYKLVGAAGGTPPASCTTGAAIYSGTATAFSHAMSTRAMWSYRLCAVDMAGNVSAGSVKTVNVK